MISSHGLWLSSADNATAFCVSPPPAAAKDKPPKCCGWCFNGELRAELAREDDVLRVRPENQRTQKAEGNFRNCIAEKNGGKNVSVSGLSFPQSCKKGSPANKKCVQSLVLFLLCCSIVVGR